MSEQGHNSEVCVLKVSDLIEAQPTRTFIPIRTGAKNPLCKWQSISHEAATRAALKARNIGWVLKQTNLIIDVDVKDGKEGKKSLARLFEGLEPPKPSVVTPSGGEHYYFCYSNDQVAILEADDGLRGAKRRYIPKNLKKIPAIDLLSVGDYVVSPPSTIGDKGYFFTGYDYTLPLAPLPDIVFNRLYEWSKAEKSEKKAAADVAHTTYRYYCPRRVIESLLRCIDPGIDGNIWRGVLASIRRWDEQEGYRLCKEWSRGSKRHSSVRGWEKSFDCAWEGVKTFAQPPNRVFEIGEFEFRAHYCQPASLGPGEKTPEELEELVYLIKDFGRDPYLRRVVFKAVKGMMGAVAGQARFKGYFDKHAEGWREEYNELKASRADFWALVAESGYPSTHLCSLATGGYYDVVEKLQIAPKKISEYKKHFLPRQRIESGDLVFVDGVAFRPDTHEPFVKRNERVNIRSANGFNLNLMTPALCPEALSKDEESEFWKFFACYLVLISTLTGFHEKARGEMPYHEAEKQNKALIGYICDLSRPVHKRLRWAAIISGPQGIGKSLFGKSLCSMISPSYSAPLNITTLGTDFNSSVRDVLFMVINEYECNDAIASTIERNFKPLISDDDVQVTAKGKDALKEKVFTNFLILSNKTSNLPISKGDRRFAYFKVNLSHWDELEEVLLSPGILDYKGFFPPAALRKAEAAFFADGPRMTPKDYFGVLGRGEGKFGAQLKYMFQNAQIPRCSTDSDEYTDRLTAPYTYSARTHHYEVGARDLYEKLRKGDGTFFGKDYCVYPLAVEELERREDRAFPRYSTTDLKKKMEMLGLIRIPERPRAGQKRVSVYIGPVTEDRKKAILAHINESVDNEPLLQPDHLRQV